MNFARYTKVGQFSHRMVPPGKVQVSGFSDDDTYLDVIRKGSKGLQITAPPEQLSLLISNGLVTDMLLGNGKPWTLGGYTVELGGTQSRGKRTFGIIVPFQLEEELDDKELVNNIYKGIAKHYNLQQ